MLRSVLNQYGTLFVPYIPKCPIEVCHTNVNAEYNDNEQNKTHGNIKESKTILARGVQDLLRTLLPAREQKHYTVQLNSVCLPACRLPSSPPPVSSPLLLCILLSLRWKLITSLLLCPTLWQSKLNPKLFLLSSVIYKSTLQTIIQKITVNILCSNVNKNGLPSKNSSPLLLCVLFSCAARWSLLFSSVAVPLSDKITLNYFYYQL